MLANLLHKFVATESVVKGNNLNNWRDYLVAGDMPEFAAGVLYALSGQYIDERDYLVDCSEWDMNLDYYTQHAYRYYTDGDYDRANEWMQDSEPYWESTMADCDRTNPYFEQIQDHVHNFFDAEDWQTSARTNYNASKDLVDHQWEQFIQTCGYGAYFNCGMFYGRVYMILSTGSMTFFNRIAVPAALE